MAHEADWAGLAGNGACVPMPKTTTEISDRFVVILVGAPEFKSLQKAVSYTITLDMMFGVLRAAVLGVESRCKSQDARLAYLESLEELALAHRHYQMGEIDLGRLRVQLAQHLFRWSALPRSRSMATRYVDTLRLRLAETLSVAANPIPLHG